MTDIELDALEAAWNNGEPSETGEVLLIESVPALVARVRELESKSDTDRLKQIVELQDMNADLRARLETAEKERDAYRDKFSTEFSRGMDIDGDLVDARVQLRDLRAAITQLADEWESRELDPWYWSEPASELRALIQSDTGERFCCCGEGDVIGDETPGPCYIDAAGFTIHRPVPDTGGTNE